MHIRILNWLSVYKFFPARLEGLCLESLVPSAAAIFSYYFIILFLICSSKEDVIPLLGEGWVGEDG